VSSHIRNPLSRRLVRTRCGTVEDFWVAGLAREAVAAFAQNHSLALCIGTNDLSEVGNVPWTRSYRARHLDFCRLARITADLICVHVTVIVCLSHLRSDQTALAQQQTSHKDDDRAVPSGEFHEYSSLSSGNHRSARGHERPCHRATQPRNEFAPSHLQSSSFKIGS
jgi:hypothetical protein